MIYRLICRFFRFNFLQFYSRLMLIAIALFGVINAISPSPSDAPLPSFRTVPHEIVSGSSRRIAFSELVPFYHGKTTRKSPVQYGRKGELDALDESMETIPPFNRIEILRHLLSQKSMRRMQLAPARFSENSSIIQYMKFLVGNAYMEAEVLKIIFSRIFIGPKKSLKSAKDLSRYFRTNISEQVGYSLNFLSPRVIKDWCDLICEPSIFRIGITSKLKPHVQGDSPHMENNKLVVLELASFREILGLRHNKLILSGYENIDL